ncbi:MAG: tRNA epoxyqueuosine(34) reductase QueG [Planctomycetota bacterium]
MKKQPKPALPPILPSSDIKAVIRETAKGLGFIAVGFTPAGPSAHGEFFRQWLAKGMHAGMEWIEEYQEARLDTRLVEPGTATVIAFAFPYRSTPFPMEGGRAVARYLEPEENDYHRRVKHNLRTIADMLAQAFPTNRFRVMVDTPPIFEREVAAKAGLGFVGKNCCLIKPGFGSYFYLGEIVTDLVIPADGPPPADGCGDCDACIKACPTGALTAPYTLDARKCLSYLSLEFDEEIPEELAAKMTLLAGCDKCQEACPHNRLREAEPPPAEPLPSVDGFLAMGPHEFGSRYGRTAFARPGYDLIHRNAEILKKNS